MERAQHALEPGRRRHAGRAPQRRHHRDAHAYAKGLYFDGDIDIPIIDWRHYLEEALDMHNSHQSFASRQRMLDRDGHAANQVIWFTDARTAARSSTDARGASR